MPLTDAQRRANNKYNLKNYVVLGCKIRKEKADTFKAACAARGTSPNAIFTAAIDDFLSRSGTPDDTTLSVPDTGH